MLERMSAQSRPFSSICLGTRNFSAIFSFSNSVYPEISITSMRSRRGYGMLCAELAVVMNITSERS